MGYFKWKGIKMPSFMMLESVPDPIRFEQVTSIIDMPEGTPLAYQSKAFKSANQPLTIGFRPGCYDSQFFKDWSGRTEYKNHTISFLDSVFSAMDDNELLNIQFDCAYNWLSGMSKLVFSNDESRYYNAVCNSQVIPDRISKRMRKLQVQFTVMPFRYLIEENFEQVTLTSYNTVSNKGIISYDGTYESEPTLRIWCTGDFAMDFGGNMSGYVKFYDIDEYVVVDIPTRRVYDKNGNVITDHVENNFMKLRLYDGLNVYIDKNVTKLEILKNTRWR